MWTEPKTGWSKTDYFQAEDYNRIKNNLTFLKGLAEEIYYSVGLWKDMGADAAPVDYPYADMINRLEDNLEQLAGATYDLDIGEKQQFVPLGAFISAEELERIESAQIKLYYMLVSQRDNRCRLKYRLGSQKGVRT